MLAFTDYLSEQLKDSHNMKRTKVFLGGTCNNSTWRDELIPLLYLVDYFNPVVEDWTPECQQEELKQRKLCDYVLYTITPEMMGVYSIAEAIDDSNKRPAKTLFCLLAKANNKEFSISELKSLKAVNNMILRNGGTTFDNLNSVADYLNRH